MSDSYKKFDRIVYPYKAYITSSSPDVIGASDSKFQYNMKQRLTDFNRVCLTRASIPKTYYLVNEGDSFILDESGTEVSVELPPGDYSIFSLKASLIAALNNASPNGRTYSVNTPNTAIEAQTFLLTISVSSGTSTFTFSGNIVAQLLGFRKNTSHTFDSTTPLVSTNPVKLQLEDTIFVHTDLAHNVKDRVLAMIPMSDTPPGGTATYRYTDHVLDSCELTLGHPGLVHFSFTNEDGDVMDFRGHNVVMELVFFKL